MKFSAYNHFISGLEGALAFNARSGAFLTFTPAAVSAIEDAIERNSTDQLPLGLSAALVEFGFLIPEEFDELRAIRARLFHSRFSTGQLSVTIAPTLACNLRCIYCYETPIRCVGVMSEGVQEATIEHIRTRARQGQHVHITWYGGEPLLVPDTVIKMSRQIRALAENLGGLLNFGIVTNGTLLTQDFVDAFADLGGDHIQITLDGPQEIHDTRRPFAQRQASSYETILHNLEHLHLERLKPVIRCNIDRSNATEALQLIDDLVRRKVRGVTVYSAPVRSINDACADVCECLDLDGFAPIRKAFEGKARDSGFTTGERPRPRSHFCGADSAFSSTIAPDGTIYKCWNHIGFPQFAAGSVLVDPLVVPPIAEWLFHDPTVETPCRDCDILPVCMGGCPDERQRQYRVANYCQATRRQVYEQLGAWAGEWGRRNAT